MNINEYYHISSNEYNTGDTIMAGSMGQIIKDHYILTDTKNQQGLVWRLFQEQTFELMRLNEFPDKPSRLKSIYLFETLNDAKNFIKKDNRDGTNIFSVKILNTNKPIHRASMKLYERIPLGRPTLVALEDQARQYWKGINEIDQKNEFKA